MAPYVEKEHCKGVARQWTHCVFWITTLLRKETAYSIKHFWPAEHVLHVMVLMTMCGGQRPSVTAYFVRATLQVQLDSGPSSTWGN